VHPGAATVQRRLSSVFGTGGALENAKEGGMTTVEELRSSGFFNVLGEADLQMIGGFTEKRVLQKGGIIYRHGDPACKFYVVTRGMVSLRELRPGDTVGIAFETRMPGEVFGVASLMPSKQYTLTAVCQEDTELLEVDVGRLEELIQANPLIGYVLMKEVARIYFERYKLCKRQLYEMVKTPTLITALPG
jgi:signal-transduction protein with cAMP-binding, CBS, and nucleotidyltransferase domain